MEVFLLRWGKICRRQDEIILLLLVLSLLIPRDQASSWDSDKRMRFTKPLMTLLCICSLFTEPGASPVIFPNSCSTAPAEIQKPSLWGKSSQSPKAKQPCCDQFSHQTPSLERFTYWFTLWAFNTCSSRQTLGKNYIKAMSEEVKLLNLLFCSDLTHKEWPLLEAREGLNFCRFHCENYDFNVSLAAIAAPWTLILGMRTRSRNIQIHHQQQHFSQQKPLSRVVQNIL